MPGNPPEFGGRNASLIEQFVHREEMGRRQITASFNPQGLDIIVPSILTFGTDEQKQRWAVPILRAEITGALGMSEPDAGSDLASLRTRAVLDGDHFVVNGQKVWTSGAHDADVILTFVRTDPDVPKHKGISVLLVPTDSPGLTARPFGSVVAPDELDFNEVFFDDVVVPAENLVGELNAGWRVANGSLGHERAMLWLSFAERLDSLLDYGGAAIVERGQIDDALVLDDYARLAIDVQALRLLGFRTLAQARRGMEAPEQSILKLFGSEAVQEASLRLLEAAGPDALDPTQRIATVQSVEPGLQHRELVRALPAQLLGHDRRGHVADPTEHHRRASPRPASVTVSTFVLVHGGGHGGWCYSKVKRLLEEAGHEVFAPSLTGLAEHAHLLSPEIDLDLHIDDIVRLLHSWDLHDVVLVGHSYGGMVITGAADRAPERIAKLVYLDAANPAHGQSLVDIAGPIIEMTRPSGAVVDGVELVLLPSPEAGAFYGVTDPDDLAWMADRLTGHPWRCFEQKLMLSNEEALWAIPQYHVVCESTIATRDPELMRAAAAEGRLWQIDTGHDLMITEPAFVASALREIAAA